MSAFVEMVRDAPNARVAMMLLAASLERIELQLAKLEATDGWDSWEDRTVPVPVAQSQEFPPLRNGLIDLPTPAQHGVTVIQGDDSAEVIIPPPNDKKRVMRSMFENQSLHIGQYLNDDSEDWNAAYVKGGPHWLYLGNRELVMSLPLATRQAMVADVEEDAPAQAREMARDILKAPGSETGPGAAPALADEFAGGVSR